MSILKILNNTYLYHLLVGYYQMWSVKKDPRREMKRVYKKVFHHYPNLDKPEDLIEKIFWLQLNTDTSLWVKCADKYRMREYVESCGLGEFLPKLYAKWDNPVDICISNLPPTFILKTNNGCAQCIIVKDKDLLSINEVRNKFKKWMSIPYGYSGGQLHYTRINPCIIAEELLVQSEEQSLISPSSLIDYKVWCINGNPESVLVCYNRRPNNLSIALYDKYWNPMPEHIISTKADTYHSEIEIPRPTCFDEMLRMSEILSKPFKEVRVDFYVINDKPIVGELTFSTGFGYFTKEYYKYLGNKINLERV